MNSPITNRWGEVPLERVPCEHFIVFRGVEGAAYNHHHQVTSMAGRLYVSWSNGAVHEDAPGQHMVMAVSDDAGETWSAPSVVAGPQRGRVGEAVLTAMGIHVHQGRMAAYYGYYDYDERGVRTHLERGNFPKQELDFRVNFDTHTGILVSSDGGATWEGPVARIDRFVPNLGPQRMADGRLILPGNMWFPYTDDPYGVEGWAIAGLPRLPEDYYDDPEGFWYGRAHRGDEFVVCEASCYETADGVIRMMLRCEAYLGCLAVTESRDRGVTWSEPCLTGFSDANCRHHFGRLPDGRCFAVSCPEPGSQRTPMVLSVSEDGTLFDRHFLLADESPSPARLEGHHKSGRYGYPTYHLAGDTLFVAYSINKEDIAVCRVPLSGLG